MEITTNLIYVFCSLHLKHKVFYPYYKDGLIEWFKDEKNICFDVNKLFVILKNNFKTLQILWSICKLVMCVNYKYFGL